MFWLTSKAAAAKESPPIHFEPPLLYNDFGKSPIDTNRGRRVAEHHSNHPDRQQPQIPSARVGVLLINLGTPQGCDSRSVRRYLAEFLSDRRVIELRPWLWLPILHGIILRNRPRKVAEAYRAIWIEETDESPLRFYTRRQADGLSQQLAAIPRKPMVAWAMRYGEPSIPDVIATLQQKECERILIAPLYPQYSATSTATVNDTVFDTLKAQRRQPAIRLLPPYYDHPAYIEALAESVERYLDSANRQPDVIVASYHGLPQACCDAGDPYEQQCTETTRLLRARLGLDAQQLRMSFQSRFGPKRWLQPYTDKTLIDLARDGAKRVAVITPGFAADCLETLEEIGMRYRKQFLEAGGIHYDLIPCLNDSETGLQMLEQLVLQDLGGWI
jgi:protoporphyrin/coproporphyrin ferrochelatase